MNDDVAIVIPVYNEDQVLLAVVEDVLSTFSRVVCIDDGSTDKSTNYLSTIELKVPNLRVIYTKGIGLVNALNLGIRESSNNWIARYDVDDTYPSYRVAKQKKLISSDVAAVENIAANVTTVAGISSDVTSVAGISIT